jgi:hypothetical protein
VHIEPTAGGEVVPCLFCEDSSAPKTTEHVIQRAFGAELRLDDEVCTDCNTKTFSAVDKRFIDWVKRYHCYPQSGFRGLLLIHGHLGSSYDPDLGVWTTVRHSSRGIWACLPQLVQHPDGTWQAFATEIREVTRMCAELSSPSPQNELIRNLLTGLEPSLQLTIVRTGPGKFLLRCGDEATLDALARDIQEGRFQPFTKESVPYARARPDPIRFQIGIPFGSIARSLAKNTVSFLCKVYGGRSARHPSLRPLKDIALGRQADWTKLVHVFLRGSAERSTLDVAVDQAATHAMMLLPSPGEGTVQAITWLYGTPVGRVFVPAEVVPGDAKTAAILVGHDGVQQVLRMPRDVTWFARFLGC